MGEMVWQGMGLQYSGSGLRSLQASNLIPSSQCFSFSPSAEFLLCPAPTITHSNQVSGLLSTLLKPAAPRGYASAGWSPQIQSPHSFPLGVRVTSVLQCRLGRFLPLPWEPGLPHPGGAEPMVNHPPFNGPQRSALEHTATGQRIN